MANIMITDYCNQSCPYCFAKKIMKSRNRNISMDNFMKSVDFLEKSREKKLGFIGGEPTLHPKIIDILDYGINKFDETLLFTNGIIDKEISRKLTHYDEEGFSILLNLNDREMYTDQQLDLIEFTLEQLGPKISLGYTIYINEFELGFHQELITKYNLRKNIRLGLASPIAGESIKDFFKRSDMPVIKDSIIRNAEILEKNDVLLDFDCGFFMCMFSTKDLGVLAKKTAGFKSLCNPILDIDLDQNVHCCFPLTGIVKRKISDFPDVKSLRHFFSEKFNNLKILGNNGSCMTCKYLKRGQCMGWCLGRILNENPDVLEKIQDIERN